MFPAGYRPLREPLLSALNSLSGPVWNLLQADPDRPVKEGAAFVRTIAWQAYASADHHVRVEDGHGNVLLDSYGNQDLSPISIRVEGVVYNLTLSDLGSGVVLVEVE